MTDRTSFETDVLPLFTQRDIQAMSKAFNLASYDDVRAHSSAIYDLFEASAARSCRLRRRGERAPGLSPGLISSGDG
jgi:hypothetical protein